MKKIPIVSHSVGGSLGRKVLFYSASGEVFISYISQEINVIDKENNYLNRNLSGR